MSLSKQFLKSKPVCKVRFRLNQTEAHNAENASLVGDFNGWDDCAMPMKRLRDGSFSIQVDLETGKKYRFRYLLGDGSWANDTNADRYEFCSFAGEDNSIIEV